VVADKKAAHALGVDVNAISIHLLSDANVREVSTSQRGQNEGVKCNKQCLLRSALRLCHVDVRVLKVVHGRAALNFAMRGEVVVQLIFV